MKTGQTYRLHFTRRNSHHWVDHNYRISLCCDGLMRWFNLPACKEFTLCVMGTYAGTPVGYFKSAYHCWVMQRLVKVTAEHHAVVPLVLYLSKHSEWSLFGESFELTKELAEIAAKEDTHYLWVWVEVNV